MGCRLGHTSELNWMFYIVMCLLQFLDDSDVLSFREQLCLSLISSETFLSARSKRSKGRTYTREMIVVFAVSFVFARTPLRVVLAFTPKRSLVELFCSRALLARAQ